MPVDIVTWCASYQWSVDIDRGLMWVRVRVRVKMT